MQSRWLLFGCGVVLLTALMAGADYFTGDDAGVPDDEGGAQAGDRVVRGEPVQSAALPRPVGQTGPMPSDALTPVGCSAGCLDDDEDGYEWAEAHHVDDPAVCIGASEPFNNGCRLYVEIQAALGHPDDDRPPSVE